MCSQPSVKATDAAPVSGILFTAQVLHRHSCLSKLCLGKMVFLLHYIVTNRLLEEVKTAFEQGSCLLIQFSVRLLLFLSSTRQGRDKVPEDSAVSEK